MKGVGSSKGYRALGHGQLGYGQGLVLRRSAVEREYWNDGDLRFDVTSEVHVARAQIVMVWQLAQSWTEHLKVGVPPRTGDNTNHITSSWSIADFNAVTPLERLFRSQVPK